MVGSQDDWVGEIKGETEEVINILFGEIEDAMEMNMYRKSDRVVINAGKRLLDNLKQIDNLSKAMGEQGIMDIMEDSMIDMELLIEGVENNNADKIREALEYK